MKTLTQVVLPIAAVIGLVGFITFISNYTKSDTKPTLKSVEGTPLRFQHTMASPEVEGLDYWRKVYEVGERGHFDYWFANFHPQEVTISVDRTNCQCTSAELGLIPKEAWNDYLQGSAAQGFLGFPGGAMFGAANAVRLNSKIAFQPLTGEPPKKNLENPRYQVPAADSRFGPALGIVRMNWVPQGTEASRNLEATVLSQLPNKTAVATKLTAHFGVMPPLHVFVPQTQGGDVKLGTLLPYRSASDEFICWSATRSELNLSISAENLGDAQSCVEWSNPVALTEEERLDLGKQMTTKGPAVPLQSAYRVKVTAYERRTIEKNGKKTEHQLDLGPLDFRLVVANQEDPHSLKVPVSAVVTGDIRLTGTRVNNFRIMLGEAFNADLDCVARVSVWSDRPGLDVEFLEKETQPEYLKVEFAPRGETEGRKEWELKVTVPANAVIGLMPPDSHIVLRTKDATQRRIKIPIRGTGVGSGLPRL